MNKVRVNNNKNGVTAEIDRMRPENPAMLCIHRLFELRAKEAVGGSHLFPPSEGITYSELSVRANRIGVVFGHRDRPRNGALAGSYRRHVTHLKGGWSLSAG